MSWFHRFQSRTVVRGRLEMLSALSIGSRLSLEPTGTDLPVVRGPDGLPFIPGSTLKGVIRAQAERILRTIDRRPDLWSCDPFENLCIQSEIQQGNRTMGDALFAEQVWAKSCLACRLFGSPLLGGRLFFKDAPLSNATDLPVVTQIRDGVGIDRDLGAARHGIKYDFEVVVPGTLFDVEIVAENVEPWELGFVLSVLRLWQEGALAIGGKATRGPGWGRLTELRLQRLEQAQLISYLSGAGMPEATVDSFLSAFSQRLAAGGPEHA
jgi:CRISPR-associated protein Csm3